MAAREWVRVQDSRTGRILRDKVLRSHLNLAPYLKEVPSSRAKNNPPAGDSGPVSQKVSKK